MQLNSTEISELIKQRIAQFNVVSEAHNEGTIVSVSDGVIRIHGLADCMQGEMISLPGNRYASLPCLARGAVAIPRRESIAGRAITSRSSISMFTANRR